MFVSNCTKMVDVTFGTKFSQKFPFFLCVLFVANLTVVDIAAIMKFKKSTDYKKIIHAMIGCICVLHWMSWILCTNMKNNPTMLSQEKV